MRDEALTASLPSLSKARGFYAAIAHHAPPDKAWRLAMETVGEATGCHEDAVRGFLASRDGRYFADEVAIALVDGCDLASALDEAIERWMQRQIDDQIEDEVGIPAGLPYLTGFVRMHEALLEIEPDWAGGYPALQPCGRC